MPPPDQIGLVVKDMDAAMNFYSSTFGWGPFQIHEARLDGCIHRGKRGNCRLKIGIARQGPIDIELIQVLEGETPHTEFLREKGEGLQHLRFSVPDIKGMLADFAKQGIEPIFYYDTPKVTIAYLNSDKIGGVMIELMELR